MTLRFFLCLHRIGLIVFHHTNGIVTTFLITRCRRIVGQLIVTSTGYLVFTIAGYFLFTITGYLMFTVTSETMLRVNQ